MGSDELKHLRKNLIAGMWAVVLAVSMAGWLAALAWLAYLLVERMI
jgi:hypothetical protein